MVENIALFITFKFQTQFLVRRLVVSLFTDFKKVIGIWMECLKMCSWSTTDNWEKSTHIV